jgi:uncharacterized membrane protein YhaH (DUF805 family)
MGTRCRRFWESVVIHFPFLVCSDISVYVQRAEERSFSWQLVLSANFPGVDHLQGACPRQITTVIALQNSIGGLVFVVTGVYGEKSG